jgi:DNA-binding MarR family transcriptional regulator
MEIQAIDTERLRFKVRLTSGDSDLETSRNVGQLREKLVDALKAIDQLDAPAVQPNDEPINEYQVQTLQELRRLRVRFFDADLFADPAWDLLLYLYAAGLTRRLISIKDATIGAGVPATTALRWIKFLEQKGLVKRTGDPKDGRRVFLSLTSGAADAMRAYFKSLPPGATPV